MHLPTRVVGVQGQQLQGPRRAVIQPAGVRARLCDHAKLAFQRRRSHQFTACLSVHGHARRVSGWRPRNDGRRENGDDSGSCAFGVDWRGLWLRRRRVGYYGSFCVLGWYAMVMMIYSSAACYFVRLDRERTMMAGTSSSC